MSIVRVGSNLKYADGWGTAFGSKKAKSAAKTTAKKTTVKKKAAKRKAKK